MTKFLSIIAILLASGFVANAAEGDKVSTPFPKSYQVADAVEDCKTACWAQSNSCAVYCPADISSTSWNENKICRDRCRSAGASCQSRC